MNDEESSALGGTATGATTGMMFGPIGAVVGGLIGAGAGFFFGSRAEAAKKKAMEQEIALAENKRALMENQSLQQKRLILRQDIQSQAMAASAEAQSGAEISSRTSAVGGARGQIQGQTGTNLFQNQYTLNIGEKMINEQEAKARLENTAESQQGMASMFMQLGKLGGPIGRISGMGNPFGGQGPDQGAYPGGTNFGISDNG